MKKLYTVIMGLWFVTVSCSKNEKVDSPILGEYEFGFVEPIRISVGELIFNADGTVIGMKDGVVVDDEQKFTYDFKSDSLFILKCSFQGDVIETTFAIKPQTPDSILLKQKSKIRRVGADAPAWIKQNTNQFTVSEYDEDSDSIKIIAFLKKK